MIEGLLRRAMERLSLRLQVHPRLERYRARMPYFCVTFLITCLLLLPAVGILLLAQALGYRGTAEVSLMRSWLTIAALPPGIALLTALLGVVGRASGYQPFRMAWQGCTREQARALAAQLQRSAESQGFTVGWCDDGTFVGVRNIELEQSRRPVGGSDFPMRITLSIRHHDEQGCDVALTVANRSITLWDTGEGDTCRRVGYLVAGGAGEMATSASPPASRS